MSKNNSRLLKPVFIIALTALFVYLISCAIKYISMRTSDISEQGLRSFLEKRGWHSGALVDEREVIIPESFGEVYERYNELQKQSGFDLWDYRATRVKQFTFEIKNTATPDGQPLDSAYAHILTYGARIIGGDVSSASLYGFMYGL